MSHKKPPSLYDFKLSYWLCCEVFSGNQLCWYGVNIHFVDYLVRIIRGLMCWVSWLHILFILNEYALGYPAHSTRGIVVGVRRSLVSCLMAHCWANRGSQAVTHNSPPSLWCFLMALPCIVMFVVRHHERLGGNPVCLLKLLGCSLISVPSFIMIRWMGPSWNRHLLQSWPTYEKAPQKPTHWCRYVDNTRMDWFYGKEELGRLQNISTAFI
jgi:hypothetical protein